ncbi:Multidrug resistance protein MdtG [Sodalis praecaptivus]
MTPEPILINWKRNLFVTWIGCFLTCAAFSLVMPFLPLYVELLGVSSPEKLNLWSGAVFSITFLFSAIASPIWGGLADRKGRKVMLLRSALSMAIVMTLMGLAQNVWQFLILRALLGLLGGFVPNANALIATQVPRNKSGWALGTLSTGAVSGALIGPLIGGCWRIFTVYGWSSSLPRLCCSSALLPSCCSCRSVSPRA